MLAPAPTPRAADVALASTGGLLWFDASQRLPRRGQRVRILTARGIDHEARFDVAYTDNWPAGVSWHLAHGDTALPFVEVASWSPNPMAAPPREERPGARTAAPPVGARVPAIVAEAEREVARTRAVLRMLPPTHLDWSPHPTVPTLRTLAHRLVRIVARMGWILDLDTVELAFEPDLPMLDAFEEILATFVANEEVVCNLVRTVDAEVLREPWALERNAEVLLETTRGEALRRFGLTPLVHHRGEMSLMLAAIGVTPPHVYPEWAFADTAAEPPR